MAIRVAYTIHTLVNVLAHKCIGMRVFTRKKCQPSQSRPNSLWNGMANDMNFNYVLTREKKHTRVQGIGNSDFYSYCLRVLFAATHICLTFWPSVVQVRADCVKTFTVSLSQTHTDTLCMWVTKLLQGIFFLRIQEEEEEKINVLSLRVFPF